MIGRIRGTNDLQYALGLLSSACDGATSRDSAGFNRYDSSVGHRMAQISQAQWSEGDKKDMLRLLRKYKKQLLSLGFDYDKELVEYFYLDSLKIGNVQSKPMFVRRER